MSRKIVIFGIIVALFIGAVSAGNLDAKFYHVSETVTKDGKIQSGVGLSADSFDARRISQDGGKWEIDVRDEDSDGDGVSDLSGIEKDDIRRGMVIAALAKNADRFAVVGAAESCPGNFRCIVEQNNGSEDLEGLKKGDRVALVGFGSFSVSEGSNGQRVAQKVLAGMRKERCSATDTSCVKQVMREKDIYSTLNAHNGDCDDSRGSVHPGRCKKSDDVNDGQEVYVYASAEEFEISGEHEVTLRVKDGEGGSTTETVTVSVEAANDPPTAKGDGNAPLGIAVEEEGVKRTVRKNSDSQERRSSDTGNSEPYGLMESYRWKINGEAVATVDVSAEGDAAGERSARKGRNPQTGKEIKIPAKKNRDTEVIFISVKGVDGSAMTKAELIDAIASEADISKADAKRALNAFINTNIRVTSRKDMDSDDDGLTDAEEEDPESAGDGSDSNKPQELRAELAMKERQIKELEAKVARLEAKTDTSTSEKSSVKGDDRVVRKKPGRTDSRADADAQADTSAESEAPGNQKSGEKHPGFVNRLLGSIFG